MNLHERASKVVIDYENLKDTGPPGYNQAVLRDLIASAMREVERELLKREAKNENRTAEKQKRKA